MTITLSKMSVIGSITSFCLTAGLVAAAQASPSTFPALPPRQQQAKTKVSQNLQRKQQTALPVGGGYYEGEDWTTRGNWVGHYGSQYAVLCANGSPRNHYIINGKQFFVLKTTEFRQVTGTPYRVFGQIGPHNDNDDGLRHWIQWLRSDDPRVLFDPVVGYRREGEWDDHGESYARSFDGPNLWVTVAVPTGLHRISLYFFNKDGHDGDNRDRDYLVELKPYQGSLVLAEASPPLARARVVNFWNGVYKKFVVRGPSAYYIKISKGGSLNTILQAVMIDKLSGP